jgi:hypothetical protein
LIDASTDGGPASIHTASSPSGVPDRRRWPAVLGAAAGLAVWLTLLDFHLVNPSPRSLDGSWEQALGYFFKHQFQAGADYVFTAGPLGYFPYRAYDADLFWYKFAWELVVKLAFAVTFCRLLAAYPSWAARLVACLVLLLSANLVLGIPDTHYTFFVLAEGILLIRSRGQAFGATRIAGVALITVLAFTKFTLLLLGLATVLVVMITEVTAGRRLKALLPLLTFAGLFVLGWCALGQSPANLPAFLYGSLQVATGYTEAMALPGDRVEILIALTTLVLLAAALITRQLADHLRSGALPAALLIGLGLFLEWKHGFVRQDQHACGFLGLTLLTPLLFPVAFPSYRWQSVPRALVLATVWLLAGFAMIRNLQNHSLDYPRSPQQLLNGSWQAVQVNCQTILHPAQQRAELDRQQAQLEAAYQLPQIKAAVGAASVDVFSFEQGVLFRNRLNWRPRPVFQSYSAYTPYLLRANADFYMGHRAPAFVLFTIKAADDRLPTLDDGPALRCLLAHYRPVLVEKGYVLLQRNAAAPPARARHVIREQVIRLNEEVPLDDPAGPAQWLSLDLKPSVVGRIWSALYKPHLLYIRLKTDDDRTLLYRLVPGMAHTGFLLNPLVLNTTDFVQLYGPCPRRRVVSFCLVARPHGPACYQPEVRMTLESLPELCPQLPVEEINRFRFPSFQTYPETVQSTMMVHATESDGRDVVLVHPEGQMRFPLSTGANRLRACYGIVAEAYETGWTEGVQFIVEYHPEFGPAQVLFQGSLEPRTRPGDRGPHELDLPLSSAIPGTLVLRTTAIPGKSTDCGWSYWSDVRIK